MPGGPTAAAAHAMRPAELQMDPRSLPAYHQQPATTPLGATSSSTSTQVDVSTQVDLHEGASLQRGATPLYSREDIKEQYCITNRQLDAVEKSSGGIFGCLTSRGPSPCSSAAKASILSACVRSAPSDENLCDAPYPYPYPSHHPRGHQRQMPPLIMYKQPYSTYPRHMSARYPSMQPYPYPFDDQDDEDWHESSFFRRRPKSFYSGPDPKRYVWVPEDEEPTKLEGPRSVLPPSIQQQQQPLAPALHTQQTQQQQQQQQQQGQQQQQPAPITKGKHVSFARSHTLTSFDMPRTKSPPRPHNQERLIDSQPTVHTSMASALSKTHPAYLPPEPRIVVLEKQPKRGTMKAQATQTEVPPGMRGRVPPVTLSPRTIHRVKMVSQGAQTNGMLNGRKLHKSYSEAGKLGTQHGIGALKEEPAEHEPLQRTQSEEPPRSPFIIDTPPRSPAARDELPNGDFAGELAKKEVELDDEEILIDFKPAPVSPDARALLEEMAQPYRRYVSLQKTLSDGEIQVERRELMSEIGEPSYPHTCRRNHPQDPWSKKLHAPVQFSSTPEDLSLLRITSPPDDHNDEEFHENLVRRGLFRKRSVSLEDGVQVLATSEYILPRSLPTSPTSPTSAAVPSRMARGARGAGGEGGVHQRHLLHAGFVAPSPFASSDSLANDVTRDHSDGIWNESQATVLQADERSGAGLLTPSSKRRHLLILQHQQRSSMDTDALDAEDEMDIYPSSPRIRLEAPTPVTTTPTTESTYSNGRSRLGYLRRSPGPSLAAHSQSSSEFGLSRSGTTDISETSTTDDYITANTSTGTGTTTGTATSSLTRPPGHMHKAPSGPLSATATQADGSSFESASSVYSLARSEAVLDQDPSSPRGLKDKSDSPYSSVQQQQQQQHEPSPARSSSSSSSGSYDLEDAMPDATQEGLKPAQAAAVAATEQEVYDGHRSSSGGYAESPPDPQFWTEEERRRRKKTFTLDFPAGLEPTGGAESADVQPRPSAGHESAATTSLSPNHRERYRSRAKSLASRSSPHRNNKRRSFDSATQQQVTRSPQKEEWREQTDDAGHVPTSDDSSCSHPSCSHHYHVHHHHPHHHVHREAALDARHRRTRESPRRKSGGHLAARRRGSRDEVSADIVQPPAGFADSPEGGHRQTSKHTAGHRLFKKFDKRYRSEDRSERRYHSSSMGRSDLRARSEERGIGTGSRYGDDFSRDRFHTRSTDASMEILTGREDEDAYTEPYTSYEWLYISDFEESCAWRRPDTTDDDDDDERRGIECTESEKKFKKKYQAATHRVYLHSIYWKSTGEMFKRVQSKNFKSDKKVVVRRKAGGEFGFRIHGSKPVMISAIEPDTPAESSGVGVGDIVVSVNGKSVLEAVHSEVVRLAQSNPDELELEVASTSNVVAPPHLGQAEQTKQEPALYSGYLWRKSMSTSARDKWMRRWFALRRNNCLYFYKTDLDSQPVGAVMLLKYVVELTHEPRPHSFAISKYGAPTLHLAADTDELAARWCSLIREAVERNNQADTWLEGSLRLQSLPANMIQRAHCNGYLSKQHERARRASSPTGWSRRYCVLRDAVMYFYEDAGAERAFGVACLQGYRVLNSASTSGGRKHAFELQPPDPTQRTYTFACDSEMDKKRWLAALEYSIDRWIKIG